MESNSIRWKVRLFGPLEVDSNGVAARFRTKKTASLFAYLVLQQGRRFSREMLAAFFWPDAEFDGARQSLRMALSDLRSVLGGDILISDRETVQLVPGLVSSDVGEFEFLCNSAKANSEDGKEFLETALQLVHGGLLHGMNDDWITPEWLRIQDQIASAGLAFMAFCEESGDFEVGIKNGKRLLNLLDFREDLHIGIMRLYVKEGSGSMAIAQFEELERQLDELWGEPPSQAAINVLESVPRGTRKSSMPVSSEVRSGKMHLIGRNSVIDELVSDLQSAQNGLLLTLMGPGGSGKTSVAIECVRQLETCFEDRIWFVDLTASADAETAIRKLQSVLNIQIGDISEAIPTIIRALRGEPCLLVLDNFEQLMPDSADWVAELAKGARNCHFLMTSRIALNLAKERRISIGSLDLPNRFMTLAEIRNCAAVQLYEREGQAANPRFSVTPDNALSVVELCNRLDGLPLALELAAARLTTFTSSEILSNIERSMDFLLSTKEGVSPRHSSLARTIDWSYNLLSPDLQNTVMRLSLICGKFSMKTAQCICDRSSISTMLESLVDSSILCSDTSGDESQFWMLEILRTYAFDRLESSAEFSIAVHDLICHFSIVANDISHSDVLRRTEKIRQLSLQSENLLVAVKFGVSNKCAVQETAELILNLVELAQLRDFSDQLEILAKDVFSWMPNELEPLQRARLAEAIVRLGGDKRDADEAIKFLSRYEPDATVDQKVWAKFKFRLATLQKSVGNYEQAMAECLFVRNELEDVNDPDINAHILYTMALISGNLGNYDDSLSFQLQALKVARRADNPNLLIRCLYDSGSELAHQGRGEEALPLFDEAIELCKVIDSQKLEGLSRWHQGAALLSLKRPNEALQSLKSSIELVIDSGFQAGLKWIFLKTAESLEATGQLALASKFLGKCITVRIAESRPLAVNEQESVDQVIVRLQSQLGEFVFDRFWNEGIDSDWDELVSEVMKLDS